MQGTYICPIYVSDKRVQDGLYRLFKLSKKGAYEVRFYPDKRRQIITKAWFTNKKAALSFMR